jgi:hypothetical protein
MWQTILTYARMCKSYVHTLQLKKYRFFQTFDREKYRFIQVSEVENNNTQNLAGKTSLSLAGLRIDERGGIYLNPLLDSNSAYFKSVNGYDCYSEAGS